ncbi:MAG: hypothetical protein IKH57_25450, partial [Clostridia bacterium]|nr:hypothetical protein [Clostridia bacterium]
MYRLLKTHPELQPFEGDINLRMERYKNKLYQLLQGKTSLKDFANAHKYYGFHHLSDGWVYREWAPAADQIYLAGDFNNWSWTDTPLNRIENGNWELFLPGDTVHGFEDGVADPKLVHYFLMLLRMILPVRLTRPSATLMG